MRHNSVSVPTAVASTTRRPDVLTVAPTTSSPDATSTGRDSPVTRDASMAELPSTTRPSVATFSPGRTTKWSPTLRASMGTVTSWPSRTTRTDFAPICNRACRADPASARFRASIQRPTRMKVMTPTDASK